MRPSPEDEGWKDPDRLPNIYKVKRTYPRSSDENSLLGLEPTKIELKLTSWFGGPPRDEE